MSRHLILVTTRSTELPAPVAGQSIIYPKADGLWYSRDENGVETLMSSGISGGGPIASTDLTDSADLARIVGNIATATALQTSRTIAGVGFNGTANIAIPSTGLSDSADLVRRNANSGIRLTPVTFASLTPGVAGDIVCISDSAFNSWGAQVAQGSPGVMVMAMWRSGDNTWRVIGV